MKFSDIVFLHSYTNFGCSIGDWFCDNITEERLFTLCQQAMSYGYAHIQVHITQADIPLYAEICPF